MSYPDPLAGWFNIGVLHTALDGREGHDSYAPCTIEDLIARGYDYWALGHIHQRESVNGAQHPRIEFPGNIQGRHMRETGAKGCLLVTVDEQGTALPEFRALDVFRWEVISLKAPAAESAADVVEAARVAIADARDGSDGRALAVRVLLHCPQSVGALLAKDPEQFRAELCAQAGGDVWIEKIKLAPFRAAQVQTPTLSADATSELKAVLDELQSERELGGAVLTSGDWAKLMSRLPSGVRAAFDERWDDVFARASALLEANTSGPDQ